MSISEEIKRMGEARASLFTKATPTNADRIRAMTDEELAEFLCEINGCYQVNCPGAEMCKRGEGKANGLKNWLQQPVKEGAEQ